MIHENTRIESHEKTLKSVRVFSYVWFVWFSWIDFVPLKKLVLMQFENTTNRSWWIVSYLT